MQKKKAIAKQCSDNYGILTEASKGINKLFGDNTGRTVSLRTAQGFKKVFNTPGLDDNRAEDIVHGAMLASAALLQPKNNYSKAAGFMLIMGLIRCYQAGK